MPLNSRLPGASGPIKYKRKRKPAPKKKVAIRNLLLPSSLNARAPRRRIRAIQGGHKVVQRGGFFPLTALASEGGLAILRKILGK